jgi:hypothetical protein
MAGRTAIFAAPCREKSVEKNRHQDVHRPFNFNIFSKYTDIQKRGR